MNSNSNRPFILVVDDTPENIQVMANILSKEGYQIAPALNGTEALERVKMFSPDLVLLDLIMPGMSGFEVLETMRKEFESIPVVVVTTETNPDVAAECMKKGAIDYLTKPIDTLRTLTVVQNALKTKYLERMSFHKNPPATKSDFQIIHEYIAVDAQTSNTVMEAQNAAAQNINILITGIAGTGKTLLAKLISRIRGGGVIFDCAARNDFQEFFNTSPGWATVIENADILPAPDKLLLQNYIENESKMILTVNGNIDEALAQEGFWSNLYFNQPCCHLHLPPLTARGDDILPLFDFFLKCAAQERGIEKPKFSIEVIITLKSFAFPDNVTDLRCIAYNSIEHIKNGELPVQYFRDLAANYRQPRQEQLLGIFQQTKTLL